MLPEFEREGQRSTVKVTGDKKQQSAALFFGSRPRWHFYASGKISTCCLVL